MMVPGVAQRGESLQQHVIAFAAGGFDLLREQLLAKAPLESAVFVLAHPTPTPTGAWRLLVHEVLDVRDDEYIQRTATFIEIRPSAVARVMQRARDSRSTIVLAHSHPAGGSILPSPQDREGEARLLPAFCRRVPDVPHARLIVGPDGAHAALFFHGTERPLSITDTGAEVLLIPGNGVDGQASTSSVYDRQVRAFGADGQQRLASLRIGIIGLGGTGSVVTQQLAHLGVGTFLLVDPDQLETTNLNRVVGASPADVGRPKVEIAANMIAAINPAAKVIAYQADVCDEKTARLLLDTDFFMACTDSHGSRAVLTQLAYQFLLPAIDVGVSVQAGPTGISHVSGRVQMLAPGLPCLLCGNVLDPEAVRRDLLTDEARAADPYIVGAPTPQPAVISINSTASSLAVTMLLSAVAGIPVAARNQRLRLEVGVVARVEGDPQPGCPICSPAGACGRGDTWSRPGRIA